MGRDAERWGSKGDYSSWRQVTSRIGRSMVDVMAIVGGVVLALATALLLVTRWLAAYFITLTPNRRPPLQQAPEDYGLSSEAVQVVTEDGLVLRGWYVPGDNGATIMFQHGSPGGRQDGLVEAAFFNKHGYNVLLGSFRAHDDSDGLTISHGYHEIKDCRAWHRYLLNSQDVDPDRIGIFGESMGAALAIRYAVENPSIAVVAVACAPAVMVDALEQIIRSQTRAPDWSVPGLARLLLFWAARMNGCRYNRLGALPYAGKLSPRPLLVLQGGKDHNVPSEHGRLLYEAAGQPKEFWFVPEAGHVDFELYRPAEYERRVLAFFDQHLRPERMKAGG